MAYEILIDGSPTNNQWLNSLIWGGAWSDSDGGVVEISYTLKKGKDPYGQLAKGKSWNTSEIKALESAMNSWESIAKIDFVNTKNSASADIWYWLDGDGGDFLGWHEVPYYSTGEPLYGVFNTSSGVWSNTNNLKGGYSYATLIHELGHGLGLAHPHDGGDDGELFPGVINSFGSYGNYDLNQGIWTTMSYNDGWKDAQSSSDAYGWQATPMALDIAAIQLIYGANMSYATGNTAYTLPTSNKSGTYWSCIWDAGGNDTITANNSTDACTINLNEATLIDENAGGFISRVSNIYGGFTIANGVVIENAIGGKSADTIIGNAAHNTLMGNQGNDTIIGGLGSDSLYGGIGSDYFKMTTINDSGLNLSSRDKIYDFELGEDKIDLSLIDAKAKFSKNDAFTFLNNAPTNSSISNGAVWKEQIGGNTIVYGSNDKDLSPEFSIELIGLIDLTSANFIL
jgi:serralysin